MAEFATKENTMSALGRRASSDEFCKLAWSPSPSQTYTGSGGSGGLIAKRWFKYFCLVLGGVLVGMVINLQATLQNRPLGDLWDADLM
jgi:hypothetical protein